MSEMKKLYVPPAVLRLGSAAEQTKTGSAPLSDDADFMDNTSFPPPPGS